MNGPLNVKYEGYPLQSTHIGIVFVCSKVSKRSVLTQIFRYVNIVIQIYISLIVIFSTQQQFCC